MWDTLIQSLSQNQFFQGGIIMAILTLIYTTVVPRLTKFIRFVSGAFVLSRSYKQNAEDFSKICLYIQTLFKDYTFGHYTVVYDKVIPHGRRIKWKWGRLIIFQLSERDLENANGNTTVEYNISVTICGWRRHKAFDRLLKEIDQTWETYRTYRPNRNLWKHDYFEEWGSLPERNRDTLFGQNIQNMLDDVVEFFKPETKRFYNDRGIPYRRGYLLVGPPGTGKSTIATVLCNLLHSDLNIINLSSVTDTSIIQALASKIKVCLIEDIDVFSKVGMDRGQPKDKEKLLEMLTLGGLLMAIDGPFTNEGHILIVTTNNLDALDKALIRPGRIDKIYNIGYMEPMDGFKMMEHLYQRELHSYKNDILQVFRDREITPAQIQNIFLTHRDSITGAIDALNAINTNTSSVPNQSLGRFIKSTVGYQK